MTSNGALLAAAGGLSLVAWLWFGYPATLPLAAACLVPLVFGLPWRLARRPRPGLRLSASATRLERGTDVVLAVTGGSGWAGTATVDLRVDSMQDGGGRTVPVRIDGGRPAEVCLPGLGRGRHLVRVARVVAVDGTGLWQRTLPSDAAELGVTILPRAVPMPEPAKVPDPLEDGRPAPVGTGTGVAFAALREYQPGDDVRHIDWAASARSPSDTLYVREFVPSLVTGRLVILDPVTPAAAWDAFEEAVDIAYSLVLAGGDNSALWCPGDARVHRTSADIEERLITVSAKDGPRRHSRPHGGLPPGSPVSVSVGDDGEVIVRTDAGGPPILRVAATGTAAVAWR